MNAKNNILIARRYAKSLVELMLSNNAQKELVYKSLEDIKETLDSSRELFEVMVNPVISAHDKEEIVKSIFEGKIEEVVLNFLKLLIEKNRFSLIYLIVEEFNNMLNAINNTAHIDIISAIELDENKRNEIQQRLSNVLNKDINTAYNIDNSIIAGLVFKIGDDILDASLKKKIEELKKELIKN